MESILGGLELGDMLVKLDLDDGVLQFSSGIIRWMPLIMQAAMLARNSSAGFKSVGPAIHCPGIHGECRILCPGFAAMAIAAFGPSRCIRA